MSRLVRLASSLHGGKAALPRLVASGVAQRRWYSTHEGHSHAHASHHHHHHAAKHYDQKRVLEEMPFKQRWFHTNESLAGLRKHCAAAGKVVVVFLEV